MAAFRRMKPKALDVFQLKRHGQKAFVENRHSDAEQIMQMAVELSSRLSSNSVCTKELYYLLLFLASLIVCF